ncbi:MAG: SDR family oxidoreductase, partial [Nitrospirae bacterium]|nr:SDR family oxidoreductase [Nitrospirota bacterium]
MYLVTGGAGFIGSHIVEALRERGDRVRVLDNFSTGKRGNLPVTTPLLEILEGDFRDPETCRRAMAGVTYVLHQGALPSVPRSIADPLTSHEVNVTGTLNLLIAARDAGVRRFVFASSSSVYGDTPTLPKHEEMIPNPMSPYALNKLAGEYYCRIFHRLYGLSTVALRYFNVFGPRQDPTSQYSAVIPKFISALMAGKAPVIYGDGEQSRDFTYVEDCVRANLLACEADDAASGEAINAACNRRTTLNELFRVIQAAVGTEAAAR